MSRFQFLLLMAACLLVTFPLEFVFRARVYRRPARLLGALLPTVVLFLVWEAIAVARDNWQYNPRYVTGWDLPFSVPVEELVSFVVVPVCALLIFETVRNTLDRRGSSRS
jgi:lycopene cyclase domain-containing protein